MAQNFIINMCFVLLLLVFQSESLLELRHWHHYHCQDHDRLNRLDEHAYRLQVLLQSSYYLLF
jgi:hypothetical protein